MLQHVIVAAAANLLAACKVMQEAHGVWSDSDDLDLVGYPFTRADEVLNAAMERMEQVLKPTPEPERLPNLPSGRHVLEHYLGSDDREE